MEDTKKVPVLRFPEFSEEWKVKKLVELADITTGDKDTQNKIDDGIYPFFVRSQNIEKINSFSYDGEAILTSGDGVGVGKNFHYINGKFDYHQRVYCIFNFKGQILGKYIFFYFSEKFNKRVMRMSAKNSVDSVRRDMVTDMLIYIPTLSEQQKIADFISQIDSRIENLTKKKQLLECYKKGVMQKIFSQELRFKDDDGNNYHDWKEKKLGDLFKIKYGCDFKHLKTGNVPVMGTGGVLAYVDECLYDKPSVLIGRKGTINNPKYIDKPFWTVDTLFYTEINKNYVPYYIYLIVCNVNWKKYNEATGVPSLNTSSINSVKILVAYSEYEQQKIADFLTEIDQKISHIQSQLEGTKKYKKGLLQQMFV